MRPSRIPRIGLCAIVGLGALACSVKAQEAATLTTDADTSEITVGDRVVLTIRVEHGPGQRVEFADSLDLSPFEVLAVEKGEPQRLRDGSWSWARYTLTTFELGELEIPSFEVAVIDPDGGVSVLDTSPWGVVVSSVGIDESGDIRDVKAPLFIPLSLYVVLAWVVAILGLMALLYFLYLRHRRQPAADIVDVAAPLQRPYEVAYDRLRELESSDLLERGEVKEYYIQVSEIIRAYVEAQFRVPALELASFEVVEGLRRIGVDGDTCRGFEGFLAECDLVKFAKFKPDRSRARQIVPRARKLVDRTKVGRPAAVPAGVAAGDPGDRGFEPPEFPDAHQASAAPRPGSRQVTETGVAPGEAEDFLAEAPEDRPAGDPPGFTDSRDRGDER